MQVTMAGTIKKIIDIDVRVAQRPGPVLLLEHLRRASFNFLVNVKGFRAKEKLSNSLFVF